MSAINWTLLLEYFKVMFGWPPMALLISLVAMNKFKPAIDDLLMRLTSGEFLGQKIQAAAPKDSPQGAVTAPEPIVPSVDGHLSTKDQRAALKAQVEEESLPAELANDPLARGAIAYVQENPVQTVIEYKRVAIALAAERLYAQIYGTQIALLGFVASRNGEPISGAALVIYHSEYRRLSGNNEYSFERYIHFLVVAGAIEKLDADTDQYRLTAFGADFLAYIKSQYPLVWSQRPF
ncbi:hypothetical protein HBH1_01168 [Herbaspirillum sp. BH-1]|uniref:Uncharacterized protein n=1 Tax=Herbaspirillum frisingense TaxID=92645 RepID=A0ABU1PC22_9BURK|nr:MULTISPECIES: hypothetical protein [Herbaspirillum]MDR6582898.1 hypothetical protein [Herbaspirillum frisingense]PLY60522.1 hypothetical protein HBH1_01168 [Herbaspirillum sp. BH-1]